MNDLIEKNDCTDVVLSDNVKNLIDNTLSENTKRSYATAFKKFESLGGVLPCNENQLAEVVARFEGSAASLGVMIAAVSKAHRILSKPDPTKTELVLNVVKGYRRAKTTKQDRAQPLFLEDITRCLSNDTTVGALRDNALLLIGFTTAMRRSELVSINISDVSIDCDGVHIFLSRSKTDQSSEGHTFLLPESPSDYRCPVKALKKLIQALNNQSIFEGAIFRKISKSGKFLNRLTDQSINLIFKRLATQANIDPAKISGHSTRRGAISSLGRANVPRQAIRKLSRHKSDRMIDLYSEDRGGVKNPFNGII